MRRGVPSNPFGQSRARPPWLVAALGAAAVVLVAVVLAGLWGAYSYWGPGPKAERGAETTVILRRGAGLSEIADALDRSGAIGSSTLFMIAARANGAAGRLKAGEYAFPSGASMATVLDKVRRGQIVRHFVTIPEGVTSEVAVEILMRSPVLTGAAPIPPEGSLLPETYDVQRGDDRGAVLARMTSARDRLLTALWTQRAPDLPVRTPEEAVILASIVEKETGIAAERPRVAAVFVNRLRQGMKLESDPTIIYGLTGGRPLGRGLRKSELAAPNPYSTYQIAGLPPGPIANPGRAAIAAVLNPPRTEELFFVADGTGGHVFAVSFDQHLKNVERWRAVERQRAAQAAPAAAAGQ
jgi:UPF0755 protein